MVTESLTNAPIVDCQELCSLITCALDYSYQFGLGQLLSLDNPIEADPNYEQTVDSLFEGRDIFLHDVENGAQLHLTKDGLLKAAFEYAKAYPEKYSEIGGADGYIPQVGMKILLIALYGWPMVLTDVGTRYEKYLSF